MRAPLHAIIEPNPIPMLAQAAFAYLHFLSLFALVTCVVTEVTWYRPTLTREEARRLVFLDLTYGIVSVLVVGTGFCRALWFAKGWDFYLHNPIFWIKVGAFGVWALLSLPPTLHFLSWRKVVAAGQTPAIVPATYRRIRLFLHLELVLILVVPLLAVLMARGVGSQ